MTYEAIVSRLKNVRPHPNADRIQLALVDKLGFQVIVGLDTKEDQLGIFFSNDGCLSTEMARNNNLYARKELNADTTKSGFFGDRARIKAQTFRGERSYGFWIELDSVAWTGIDLNTLEEGMTFNNLNGHLICKKYFNQATRKEVKNNTTKNKKTKVTSLRKKYVQFKEHVDTRQLRYEINNIPAGSILWLTEKLHGTSGRTGHICIDETLTPFKIWWNKQILFPWKFKAEKSYKVVSGSRRVVINPEVTDDGWYKGDRFRSLAHERIKAFGIPKGITLYYEIVGYTDNGNPIMTPQPIDKISDKKIRKNLKNLFGEQMIFSYGCEPDTTLKQGLDWIHVYRATITNEDGFVVELPWPKVKKLCKDMNLRTVPDLIPPIVFDGSDTAKRDLLETIDEFLDIKSTLDDRHITEGVVVRIEVPNGDTYFLKDKGYIFKVLEDIIKSDETTIDTEEAEDLVSEEGEE